MITKLSFPEQARIFAVLSNLAYLDQAEGVPKFAAEGFRAVMYEKLQNSAYLLEGNEDLVLVFRGTVPKDHNTVKEDLQALRVMASIGFGTKHEGFKTAVDNLWPQLRPVLMAAGKQKKIWIAGHSLGAAMGTIAAIRCKHEPDLPDPVALFTFGSPRVGNHEYVASPAAKMVKHHRWVNCIDLVPTLPASRWGYHHHGELHYLNHWGNVRQLTMWQRAKDKFRGFIRGFTSNRLGFAECHSMDRYADCITRYAAGKENPQEGF